jgi:hypothetical protein
MPWRCTWECRYSSIILDLGSRWRWMVSFVPWPRYPQGKGPWYPLDRRLGWPQSWPGHCGEENISCPCQEWNLAAQPVATALAIGWMVGGSFARRGRYFSLLQCPSQFWGPIQPPIQWVPRGLSLRGKVVYLALKSWKVEAFPHMSSWCGACLLRTGATLPYLKW